MATTIKPVLSPKNRYHISKHRYYELKHFCLQYPEWRRIYRTLTDEIAPTGIIFDRDRVQTSHLSNQTADLATLLSWYRNLIEMVEKAAEETDFDLRAYILKAVTEGASYTTLKSLGMPCERDMYYDRYRKFFWILDKLR